MADFFTFVQEQVCGALSEAVRELHPNWTRARVRRDVARLVSGLTVEETAAIYAESCE